jgi:hypothetical protein
VVDGQDAVARLDPLAISDDDGRLGREFMLERVDAASVIGRIAQADGALVRAACVARGPLARRLAADVRMQAAHAAMAGRLAHGVLDGLVPRQRVAILTALVGQVDAQRLVGVC